MYANLNKRHEVSPGTLAQLQYRLWTEEYTQGKSWGVVLILVHKKKKSVTHELNQTQTLTLMLLTDFSGLDLTERFVTFINISRVSNYH